MRAVVLAVALAALAALAAAAPPAPRPNLPVSFTTQELDTVAVVQGSASAGPAGALCCAAASNCEVARY
jgi:hypothetical protein